jgi:hypothetical protein
MKKVSSKPGYKPRRAKGKGRRLPRFGKEILILLAMIVAVVVLKVTLHEFAHKRRLPISRLEWKRYSPPNCALSLDLPGEPMPESVPLPTNIASNIKQVDRYRYASPGLAVSLWSARLDDQAPADLRMAAAGAAESLKQVPGVTNYRDEVIPVESFGRPGLRLTGSFEQVGDKQMIEALFLGERTRLWQVVVTYPASNRDGQAATKRILDSVRLED